MNIISVTIYSLLRVKNLTKSNAGTISKKNLIRNNVVIPEPSETSHVRVRIRG